MKTIDLQSPRFLTPEQCPDDATATTTDTVTHHALPASSDEDYRVAASLAHRNPA